MLYFGNAAGALFNRLARCALLVKQAVSYANSQHTNIATLLAGDYTTEMDLAGGVMAQRNSLPNLAPSTAGAVASSLAQATISRLVYRDNPQPNQTEDVVALADSVEEVIRQMKAQGASVLGYTVSASPAAFVSETGGSGTGDGVVLASVIRPSDGLTLQMMLPESMAVECAADSYTGGRAAGREQLTALGDGSQPDLFAHDWPLGSGAAQPLEALDGSVDNDGVNFLTGGGFDSWSGGAPAGWSTVGDTELGVDAFQETSAVFGSGSALRLTGDGSTVIGLATLFGTDTPATLDPLTQYGWNCWLRRDGTAPAGGVLTVELVDANGVVVKDAAGVNNSTTIDLTALSTSYAAYNAAFRTPRVLPSGVYLRFRTTTPLTAGRSVYLDRMGFGEMVQAYTPFGPYLLVFSGSSPFVLGDYSIVTVTNSFGSGGTLDSWQVALARLFPDTYQQGVIWPYSSSPSIPDSMI